MIGNHVGGYSCLKGSNPLLSVAMFFYWPVGQAVKTPPFHGGNTGSSPVRVIVKHTNIVCMLFLFLLQTNVVESVDICCKYVILWM